MLQQSFVETTAASRSELVQFLGTQFLPLAEPVPDGSIHLLKMKEGTIIPRHTHPSDEYVFVLSGVIQTGAKTCSQGTFWFTPAYTQQGAHQAITDVELMTVRLGKMGAFETVD